MRALAFSGGKDSMACLHLCREQIDFAIFVDTGKTYPETLEMVEYARAFVPVFVVNTDQEEQNQRLGIPSEVVPIDYTTLGQTFTGPKPIKIQNYLQCHFQNISYPLFMKARELGATSMIYGQRMEDDHVSPARNGDIIDGMLRLHPIENWTSGEVLDYLRGIMDIPEHYFLKHSSLDCYDCTAFGNGSEDWVMFTERKYPGFHRKYRERLNLIRKALEESGYVERKHGT